MANEVLADNLLPVIICKFIICYEFIPVLNLDFDLLFNACQAIQQNYKGEVAFHGAAHGANMAQASHYFLQHGLEMMNILTPLDKFALFFGCMVSYCQYPGLTNDFLVRTRHPRALRYNDKGVSQGYVLSWVFEMLNDPEMNFMLHMPKESMTDFRKVLIGMILRGLDPQEHFREVSLFKTKMASEFFGTKLEDRMAVLAMTVRAADLSWSCRPLQVMLRWSEKMHDEFFMQGDVEKQLGMPVSPFCDRDVVDTSKVALGYMVAIASPAMMAYSMFLNDPHMTKQVVTEGLEANRAYLSSWVS